MTGRPRSFRSGRVVLEPAVQPRRSITFAIVQNMRGFSRRGSARDPKGALESEGDYATRKACTAQGLWSVYFEKLLCCCLLRRTMHHGTPR